MSDVAVDLTNLAPAAPLQLARRLIRHTDVKLTARHYEKLARAPIVEAAGIEPAPETDVKLGGAGSWLSAQGGRAATVTATRSGRVFSAEAMDACAEHGHRWADVPGWGGRSTAECRRCGATPSPGWLSPPEDEDADRSAAVARRRAAEAQRATDALRTPGRQGRVASLANLERNRQVLADLAAGGDPATVGARHGITRDLVYYIRSQARKRRALEATT